MFRNSGPAGRCMVTGRSGPLVKSHGLVKGLPSGHPGGTSLVSFNLGAAQSHGLLRGEGAPVRRAAAAAYVGALNWLLSPRRRHRLQLGKITLLVWAEANEPRDALSRTNDAVLFDIRDIVSLLLAERPLPTGLTIHLLGLSANIARAAVLLWKSMAIAELQANMARWLAELRIEGDRQPTWHDFSGGRLEAALGSRAETSRLSTSLIRAMAFGERVSPELLATALHGLRRRSSPDTKFLYALLKAVLMRNHSYHLLPSLDASVTSRAYRLGRLFAVLERVQILACPTIVSTIRDRFWGASSTAPAQGFTVPLRLTQAHLRKLAPPARLYFDRVIEEVMSGLQAEPLPTTLSQPEQGLFAVGYYHQKTALAGWRATKQAPARKRA
jgi:CRISPR-associated protein Csd1